ncbi:MAG: CBS domain-containing protein, partial [Kiritimatiellae bacterium]|nr:CBS domain-containing protein [Kiritimatiellia bacterium]
TLRVLPLAGVLKAAALILRPASWIISTVVALLVPVPQSVRQKTLRLVSREELLHLAIEGTQSGVLTREELRMIRGVFQLRGKTCGDIMIPRDKMTIATVDTRATELVEMARGTDVNRFPIWDPAQKAFVGIVHIYDVLADEGPHSKTAKDYMRPVQLVSAATPADHVLPRMRLTRQPMVLVTDERYEVIGLVTLADVIEEVVGPF